MADENEASHPVWNDLDNENAGQFNENGKPNGQGTLTFPAPAPENEDDEEQPGDAYVGNLSDGVRSGKGKYTWSNGCYFAGAYVDGKKHGQGVQTFPDGGKYEGNFDAGIISGSGTWTYGNGDIYKGKFVDGKKHGTGCYHCKKEGCQFVGTFDKGAFVSGRWVHRDGSTVEGRFQQALDSTVCAPCGVGVRTFKRAGLKQEGRHTDGRWVGKRITAT